VAASETQKLFATYYYQTILSALNQ